MEGDTGYICTASFRGIDRNGVCNKGCQWWTDEKECPCAKGSKYWDGKDSLKIEVNENPKPKCAKCPCAKKGDKDCRIIPANNAGVNE